MKALVLDIKREEWESTTGMSRVDIAQPQLDESKRPEDANKVIIKPEGFNANNIGITPESASFQQQPPTEIIGKCS